MGKELRADMGVSYAYIKQAKNRIPLSDHNSDYDIIWAVPCDNVSLGIIADSEGPDQPVHPDSLVSAFTVRKHNHWILH